MAIINIGHSEGNIINVSIPKPFEEINFKDVLEICNKMRPMGGSIKGWAEVKKNNPNKRIISCQAETAILQLVTELRIMNDGQQIEAIKQLLDNLESSGMSKTNVFIMQLAAVKIDGGEY